MFFPTLAGIPVIHVFFLMFTDSLRQPDQGGPSTRYCSNAAWWVELVVVENRLEKPSGSPFAKTNCQMATGLHRYTALHIYIYYMCVSYGLAFVVVMLMFSYCLYFVQTALASTNELRMMIDAIPNEKTGLDNLNIEGSEYVP